MLTFEWQWTNLNTTRTSPKQWLHPLVESLFFLSSLPKSELFLSLFCHPLTAASLSTQSLLADCRQYLLNKQQKVENNDVHLVLRVPKTVCVYISLRLSNSLHWLPINSRIQYTFAFVTASIRLFLAKWLNLKFAKRPAGNVTELKIYQTTSSSDTFSLPPHSAHALTGSKVIFLRCRTVCLQQSPAQG